ncbi:hypothetical protein P780_13625 [Vibrio mimicus CAIM 1882]|nr:hypothetical protein P780_13625 [Vibrio mimicus CAIM 1882]
MSIKIIHTCFFSIHWHEQDFSVLTFYFCLMMKRNGKFLGYHSKNLIDGE